MTKNQTERGNRYALTALKDKRATIAGEIKTLERQLRHKQEQLVHLDETLRIFDPSIDPDGIRPKGIKRHINLFKQGELSRMVRDIFRKAKGGPLTTREVVTAVLETLGHGEEARPAMHPRVLSNLYYQRRRGTLESLEKQGGNANWRLKKTQT